MKKYFFFTLLFLITLLISSCLLPENFDCKVSIKQDGTVEVVYKGSVVHAEIFTGSDESTVKSNIGTIVQNNPRISNYKYNGNGRASFTYTSVIPPNQNSNFIDDGIILFTVHRYGKKIVITEEATDIDTISQLKSFGYKIDGKIVFESELELSSPDVSFKKSGNKWIGEQKITTLSTKEIVITTVN